MLPHEYALQLDPASKLPLLSCDSTLRYSINQLVLGYYVPHFQGRVKGHTPGSPMSQ